MQAPATFLSDPVRWISVHLDIVVLTLFSGAGVSVVAWLFKFFRKRKQGQLPPTVTATDGSAAGGRDAYNNPTVTNIYNNPGAPARDEEAAKGNPT